ncbi:MAG: hypothetical protein HeimC3_33770 [Candidatus Heimdallarchaeota archaeon LC_3]|nr:MAG: hypothetical protein HeimC3_33770 [Candidatus Heimdallarchaeota archaeon LC_3]
MGFTSFKFTTASSKEELIHSVTNWIHNTEFGKNYTLMDDEIPDTFYLKKLKSIFSYPTIIKITFIKSDRRVEVTITAFVQFNSWLLTPQTRIYLPLKKGLLAWRQRSRASKDMKNLLEHLKITLFERSDVGDRNITIFFKIFVGYGFFLFVILLFSIPATFLGLGLVSGSFELIIIGGIILVLETIFLGFWIKSYFKSGRNNLKSI